MDKLREWLEITGMSPARLGREIGASENSVNNWLAGRNYPSAIYLRKLHERTDIPLEDLVPKDVAA
jgi:transcriptional regulator with XRE-family HTH domain